MTDSVKFFEPIVTGVSDPASSSPPHPESGSATSRTDAIATRRGSMLRDCPQARTANPFLPGS